MFRIVLSSGLSWASYSVILNLLFLSFWGCVATEESPQETLRLRAKALRVTKKKGWQKGQHKRVIPSLLLRVRVTYKGVILSVFSVILRHKVPKNLILSPNSFLIRDSSGYLPPRNDKKEGDPSANTSGWQKRGHSFASLRTASATSYSVILNGALAEWRISIGDPSG